MEIISQMARRDLRTYLEDIGHRGREHEKVLYAREAYSEVKSWNDFIDKCVEVQLRSEPPGEAGRATVKLSAKRTGTWIRGLGIIMSSHHHPHPVIHNTSNQSMTIPDLHPHIPLLRHSTEDTNIRHLTTTTQATLAVMQTLNTALVVIVVCWVKDLDAIIRFLMRIAIGY